MMLKFLYAGTDEIIEFSRAQELGLISPDAKEAEIQRRLEAFRFISKSDAILTDKSISSIQLPTKNSRGNWV